MVKREDFVSESGPVRRAEIFDDHFESHAFLAPGGPLFEPMAQDHEIEIQEGKESLPGKVWMVRNPTTGTSRILAWTGTSAEPCESLEALLAILTREITSGLFDRDNLQAGELAVVIG